MNAKYILVIIYFVISLKEEVQFEETLRMYFLWPKSMFGLNVFTPIFVSTVFVLHEKFENFKNKSKIIL